jgi:hypothetical protein
LPVIPDQFFQYSFADAAADAGKKYSFRPTIFLTARFIVMGHAEIPPN